MSWHGISNLLRTGKPRAWRPSSLAAARLLAALATLACSVQTLNAQSIQPDFGVGMAVPIGALGAKRDPGVYARAGLIFGRPARILRFRFDVDGAYMHRDATATPDISSATGALRSMSLAGSLLVSARTATSPFATFGIGVHSLKNRNFPNSYGSSVGLRTSVGLRHRVGRHAFALEAGAHLLLTDYGTGADFATGVYFPLQFGFTF